LVMRKPDDSLASDLLRSFSLFIKFFWASRDETLVLIDIDMTAFSSATCVVERQSRRPPSATFRHGQKLR
jgi:predicted RNase H-like nuclease